jgi:hypothetical protein
LPSVCVCVLFACVRTPWVPRWHPSGAFIYIICSRILGRVRCFASQYAPFVVLYFLPRILRYDAAAAPGASPLATLGHCITCPLGRRGLHVASVPSIWPERSTRCGAQSAVGRAKKASIRMGERYATSPTSVFRAAREGWNGYGSCATSAVRPGRARAPHAPDTARGDPVAASEKGVFVF